jgi:hypothetical protein
MKRHTLILVAAVIVLACSAFQYARLSVEVPAADNFLPARSFASASSEELPLTLFLPLPTGETKTVNFAYPDNAQIEMSAQTREDQARDWLIYTIISNSQLPADEVNTILFDLPPVRYGYSSELGNLSYGPVRSVYLRGEEIVVLYPEGEEAAIRDHLAYAADQQRMNLGYKPNKIHPFAYRLGEDQQDAQLTRMEPIDGAALFSEEYGYVEEQIGTLESLEGFMEKIDDLVYVQYQGGLLLGGRKLQGRKYKNIRVEDIAAIYQAIVKQNETLRAFERRWNSRTYRTEYEKRALEEEMAKEQMELKITDGTGFSLDPSYNYATLKSALEKLKMDTYFSNGLNYRRGLDGLTEANIVPLLEFLESIKDSENMMEQFAAMIIQASIQEHQFQAARYDGDLQGTEVGMILFYTDLIAKLWTINYKYSSPVKFIPEFRNGLKDDLGTLYAEEGRAYPSARLWFGPNRRGFSKGDKGTMYFARNTSRIFAAGSNPLSPGNEVAVSAFFGAPLNWWNNHYEEVAAFEPMYEALNEIIKWSLVINFINDQSSSSLSILNPVAVSHEHWFPNWVQQQDLRFEQWRSIGFFRKGGNGADTETLPLLSSPPYRSREGGEGYLQGGVSLARKGMLRSIPRVSGVKSPVFRRANMSASGDNMVTMENGPIINVRPSTGEVGSKPSITIQPSSTAKLRNMYSEVSSRYSFTRDLHQAGEETVYSTKFGGQPVGELVVAPTQNGFAAGFRSRVVDKGMSISRNVSEAGSVEKGLLSNTEVAYYLSNGKGRYLVKAKGEADWMLWEAVDQPEVSLNSNWGVRSSSSRLGSPTIRTRFVSEVSAQQTAKEWGKDLPGITEEDWGKLSAATDLPPRSPKALANECLENPVDGLALKNRYNVYEKQALAKIDEALAQPERYNETIARLDALAEHTGNTPDVLFRRAMADLGEGSSFYREIGIEKINRLSSRTDLRAAKNVLAIIKASRNLSIHDQSRVSSLANGFAAPRKFIAVDDVVVPANSKVVDLSQLNQQLNDSFKGKVLVKQQAGLENIDFNATPQQVMAQIMTLHPAAVAVQLPKESLGDYRLQLEAINSAILQEGMLKLKYQPGLSGSDPCNDDNDPNCNQTVFYVYLNQAAS